MVKRLHTYIFYSRPNGLTDWAEIFCGHSWVARGVLGKKKIDFFFQKKKKNFTFFLRAMPGLSASNT